jgi:hypothetical protein
MPTEISGSTGVNKIQDNTIVNADINSSAAIAGSKLVMPTGSVLQVVYGSSTTQTSSSSSSYVTTGITATITPTSTSSKILVLTKMTARGTTSTDVNTKIYKNSSAISGMASTKYNNQSSEPSDLVDTYLDSPNTTSATTYTLYAQSSVNGQAITMKAGNTRGSITVMEIAG